jgi:4-hydroxybenzoate polyprenyltransferase
VTDSLDVPVELTLAGRTRGLRPLLVALRPRQYTKNLLTLAGIIFAGEASHLDVWPRAALVFFVYCAASSAAYIVNDLLDLTTDRLHPVKRHRPLAAGNLAPVTARIAAIALAGVGLVGAAALGARSLSYLVLFLVIQAVYSWRLKRIPLLDIVLIAALFEIRAFAGAEAIHVPISGWLVACTPLLAAFLALGKRRAELRLVTNGAGSGRDVLRWYSAQLLDRLLAAAAVAAVLAYGAYAVAGPSLWLVATLPLVLAGLSRYLFLLYRREEGEEPENTLLSDPILLATVAIWAAACAALLVVD